MQWASSISLRMDRAKAVAECADALARELDPGVPDLLLVFPSGQHAQEGAALSQELRTRFPSAALLGCTAGGVIGGGHEAEGTTAIALMGALLPGVSVQTFRFAPDELPDLDEGPSAWREIVEADAAQENLAFLIFADPFTSNAEVLLQGLDFAYPACAKIGGLASSASMPGGNALFLRDELHDDGTVGVALSGNVRMDTVVAQGGRPIGNPLRITSCRGNILIEVDDRPAMEVLQETYERIAKPEDEQPAFFVGIRTDELEEESQDSDYLVRTIVGADPQTGALAVGNQLRIGQTVQFHAMSAETAAADLRALLERYRDRGEAGEASGALLFSCNGRGMNLFGAPDHDSEMFREVVRKDVPLGGLFCAGEIGPVGRNTYLHGFTSSFGILRPARPAG